MYLQFLESLVCLGLLAHRLDLDCPESPELLAHRLDLGHLVSLYWWPFLLYLVSLEHPGLLSILHILHIPLHLELLYLQQSLLLLVLLERPEFPVHLVHLY